MKIINNILDKMVLVGKSQKKFVATILETIIANPGKINFRNLSRFCSIDEKTISRNFRKSFDFALFNWIGITGLIGKSKRLYRARL